MSVFFTSVSLKVRENREMPMCAVPVDVVTQDERTLPSQMD
jgi:hypothetical protein